MRQRSPAGRAPAACCTRDHRRRRCRSPPPPPPSACGPPAYRKGGGSDETGKNLDFFPSQPAGLTVCAQALPRRLRSGAAASLGARVFHATQRSEAKQRAFASPLPAGGPCAPEGPLGPGPFAAELGFRSVHQVNLPLGRVPDACGRRFQAGREGRGSRQGGPTSFRLFLAPWGASIAAAE